MKYATRCLLFPITSDLPQRHEEHHASGGENTQKEVQSENPSPASILAMIRIQCFKSLTMIRGLVKREQHQLVVLFRVLLPLRSPRLLVRIFSSLQNGLQGAHKYALVFAPFSQGNDVGHNELGQCHNTSTSDTGKCSKHDQLERCVCQ
jgi:hypothetical protein